MLLSLQLKYSFWIVCLKLLHHALLVDYWSETLNHVIIFWLYLVIIHCSCKDLCLKFDPEGERIKMFSWNVWFEVKSVLFLKFLFGFPSNSTRKGIMICLLVFWAISIDRSWVGRGNKDLYTELWKACAGPLVDVPCNGERVYYFPQGHMEQVSFKIA